MKTQKNRLGELILLALLGATFFPGMAAFAVVAPGVDTNTQMIGVLADLGLCLTSGFILFATIEAVIGLKVRRPKKRPAYAV